MKYTDEDIARYRAAYPSRCASCGGKLGGPGTDEEIREMLKEHSQLFPGESLDTSSVICHSCFHRICPGGKKIGFS